MKAFWKDMVNLAFEMLTAIKPVTFAKDSEYTLLNWWFLKFYMFLLTMCNNLTS